MVGKQPKVKTPPSKVGQAITGCGCLIVLLVIAAAIIGVENAPPTPGEPGAKKSDTGEINFLHYLVHRGGKSVIVWKNAAAMDEGYKLIKTGEFESHSELMESLVACFAENGSKAIFEDGGMFTSTVRVLSGSADGCIGVVDSADVSLNSPVEPKKSH